MLNCSARAVVRDGVHRFLVRRGVVAMLLETWMETDLAMELGAYLYGVFWWILKTESCVERKMVFCMKPISSSARHQPKMNMLKVCEREAIKNIKKSLSLADFLLTHFRGLKNTT